MSSRPFVSSAPRRLPLAACLSAVFGLAFTAAEAGPTQPVMRRPQRSAVAPPPELQFAHIASILKAGALPPRSPSSTLHHVSSCNDDPNDPGSLRSIVAAQSTVSGDHIDFAQLPMMCSTITLGQGEAIKVYQDKLYIDGPGSGALTIDANNASPIFYNLGGVSLYISDLTIANGRFDGAALAYGGCIYSRANLFLFESVVTHCNVTNTSANGFAEGGGVYVSGTLTLVRSTISDSHANGPNGAGSAGGGVYVAGSFSSHDSTVSNNSAGPPTSSLAYAGGVYVRFGTVDIENSTIASNRATYAGGLKLVETNAAQVADSTISSNTAVGAFGGIRTDQALTVANSTVAFNHAINLGLGSGLYSTAVELTLQSSIIADNTGPQVNIDLVVPLGASIAASNSLVVSSLTPLPLGNVVDVCPRLDILADNGGYTKTHGLTHASPAIDNGDAGNSTTDQRGEPRPAGAAADIGAFERQPTDVDERILTSGFDGFCDQ